MRTTVGQLMVNKVLPEELRDYDRTLDKKTMTNLLSEVAKKYPDKYRDISHRLAQIGWHASYTTGGNSFGLRHMQQARSAIVARRKLQLKLDALLNNIALTDDDLDSRIVVEVGRLGKTQQKDIFEESLAEDNPLAHQVLSGSRGSPMNLASLRGSDLLYNDHRGRVLPIPVLRSYSQGLSPLEYWAGAYGARKGVVDAKVAVQKGGYLSKQLNQIVHRSMVTQMDRDKASATLRGLPVDVNDDESEGSLLAQDTGGFKRNTILTPKILEALRKQKIKRLLVRSPAVDGTPDGGVYARDVGVREFGQIPHIGSMVAMTAAQALSEPLAQAGLSSKHSGGVVGASADTAVSGFDRINQLIQVPKTFKGGAAHSQKDGLVQRIEDAPAGGKYVWIENEKHFVGSGYEVLVKKGQKVEAGDIISEGLPDPSVIVKYKGVGEGRRYFIQAFRDAFNAAGIRGHRRNIELLSRGLINHVRLTEEIGDFSPDDVIPYNMLEHHYQPRTGFQSMRPKQALGKYLERPYLHYSIGTKIRPSMLRDFDDFKIDALDVHDDEPVFEPEMVRGMANLHHDPDWITRMFGSGLKGSFLKSVHYGATSDPQSTSFVPSLARGVGFGQSGGKIQTPQRSLVKLSQTPNYLGRPAYTRRGSVTLNPIEAQYLGQLKHWANRARSVDKKLDHAPWFQKGREAMKWAPGPYMIPQLFAYGTEFIDRSDKRIEQPDRFNPPTTKHEVPPPRLPLPMQLSSEDLARLEAYGIGDPYAMINEYNEAVTSGTMPDSEVLKNVSTVYKALEEGAKLRGRSIFTPESRLNFTKYPKPELIGGVGGTVDYENMVNEGQRQYYKNLGGNLSDGDTDIDKKLRETAIKGNATASQVIMGHYAAQRVRQLQQQGIIGEHEAEAELSHLRRSFELKKKAKKEDVELAYRSAKMDIDSLSELHRDLESAGGVDKFVAAKAIELNMSVPEVKKELENSLLFMGIYSAGTFEEKGIDYYKIRAEVMKKNPEAVKALESLVADINPIKSLIEESTPRGSAVADRMTPEEIRREMLKMLGHPDYYRPGSSSSWLTRDYIQQIQQSGADRLAQIRENLKATGQQVNPVTGKEWTDKEIHEELAQQRYLRSQGVNPETGKEFTDEEWQAHQERFGQLRKPTFLPKEMPTTINPATKQPWTPEEWQVIVDKQQQTIAQQKAKFPPAPPQGQQPPPPPKAPGFDNTPHWYNPNAMPSEFSQRLVQFAPGMVSKGIGATGILGYGMLMDPGKMMSLMKGPGSAKQFKMPTLPKIQKPAPAPKPAKPVNPVS